MSSKMPQAYIHLNNEPSKILLPKRGIIRTEDKEISSLQSKQCPNCLEPNKPMNLRLYHNLGITF